jgi:hypothetical protein
MNSLPFERMEGESEQAWSSCLLYVLLSPDIRSVERAQTEFYKNSPIPSRKAGQASRGWQAWSSKFRWRERSAAFDTQRAVALMNDERTVWLKTKDDFNKIGEVKIQVQLRIETFFLNYLNDNENLFDSNATDENGELLNDLSEIGDRLEQVSKIQKILNESDKILYDRFLKSVGIESLIPMD